ncbi:1-acyl-sn-glycerol-3-phosphate acyltransferase [Cognatishimia sp. F0-27]|uniref:lysophospholipid acyltransferase family protein n=1 Tax=Cognatishimia sp. F0-27 TaxID=2816855 RepID=UPI001D0C0E03|nr:lysophospholipid acyltransferase family protein [Cognatishimia sp. F0-27]MCC1491877.1 1-acyl-sn-glycerol-3-phosphate acyltransferase [Cognatishimia sp. F0-27]
MSWVPPPEPERRALSAADWMRVALRAPAMAFVVFGGLALLLLLRLFERPLAGMTRPVTPHITVAVCRLSLRIMGLVVVQRGRLMTGRGALVANHASWLDIFVLNSRKTLYFVSKSEVASWPGIGWLARATGTVFIRRDRRQAREQAKLFEDRLIYGHRLLFFPEGTSTDGLRVLPFKTTLFAAFFSDRLQHEISLQAVSVVYFAPQGQPADFYGWWGDMSFAPSLVDVLAQRRQGRVELIYHDPQRVDDFPNRKTLAAKLEEQVRSGFDAARHN